VTIFKAYDLRGVVPDQLDAEAAHRCAAMLHLANITIRVRRKIKYDPVKEEIIGDLEANRFVNPPTRAPWHL